jgi:hypothetical protein
MLLIGLVSVSWLSWSLFTVNLFSLTINYVHSQDNRKVVEVPPKKEHPAPDPTKAPVFTPPKQAPESPEQSTVSVFDDKGNHGTFLISLLSDEYRWVIGSTNLLEPPHTVLNFSPEMRENINNSLEVICIGASSEEIGRGVSEEQGRLREEERAARRADTIAIWVREVLDEPLVRIRKLNIGHHESNSGLRSVSGDTSHQRRVIIVLVLEADEGLDMDQALRKAFKQESQKHPIYETILNEYSQTKGDSFNWLP